MERPTMDAVIPPEPWKGIITQPTRPNQAPVLRVGLSSMTFLPFFSSQISIRPIRGIFLASGRFHDMNMAQTMSTMKMRPVICKMVKPETMPVGMMDSLPKGGNR